MKTGTRRSSASTFVPAHISGFFQPCDAAAPEMMGSRNGGPCLDLGVVTKVGVEISNRTSLSVFINGRPAPEARTTLAAARQILGLVPGSFRVRVDHLCQIPIGSGYGASGAGALGTAISLAEALGLRVPRDRLVTAAHVAEVLCYTGLGDVGAQAFGGLVIGLEPGAPPYGKWRRIPVPRGVRVICATLGPIPSKKFLSDGDFRRRASEIGSLALKRVLKQPDIRGFVAASKAFAENLGLLDEELLELVNLAEKAGAIGASQVMIGRSVFALATGKKVEAVKKAFLEVLKPEALMVAQIYQGARSPRSGSVGRG